MYAAGVLFKTMITGSEDPGIAVEGSPGKIISTCMKMDPSERYPSAEKLKEALQQACGETSVDGASKTWRRFLPPGFRAGKPGFMIGMSLLYVFVIAVILTANFDNCPLGFLWFERICLCIAFLLIIFFSGNYLNMQGRLARIHGRRTVLRIILIVLIDAAIFCCAAIVCIIVDHLL